MATGSSPAKRNAFELLLSSTQATHDARSVMLAELDPLTPDVLRREYADVPQVKAAVAAGEFELAQTMVVLRHFQEAHKAADRDARHARTTSERYVADNKTLAISAERMTLLTARQATLAAEKAEHELTLRNLKADADLNFAKAADVAAINASLQVEADALHQASAFQSLVAGLHYVRARSVIDPDRVPLSVRVDQGVSFILLVS
jgi:hypothetical protein